MNILNVSLQHSILTLAAHGWSRRRIARELDLDRETVGRYDQIAANEGYYFAIVDESCELALDRMLAHDPNIDAKRVYLYESSAGTAFANELMAEHPDLWRGAILFGAFGGPELSDVKGKRLLIVDGTDDENGDAVKSLTKYQESAIQAGVPVTIDFLKDSGHMPNSIASERARAESFAEFLSKK